MSPLSASVAAGMTAPTSLSAALFSATSSVTPASSNTGALLVPVPPTVPRISILTLFESVYQPRASVQGRRPSAIPNPSAPVWAAEKAGEAV